MKSAILLVVAFIAAVASCSAQIQSTAPKVFTTFADVSEGKDGQIVLTASSPRPIFQALTAVRRKYGWIVDYEEGKYTAAQIEHDPERHVYPRGGGFVLSILAPRSNSDENAFLTALATQGAAAIGLEFSVVDNSRGRYTLEAVHTSEPLMLDTPVQLSYGTRTVDATIETILDLVSKKRGVPFLYGGLVDNGLLNTQVTMGGGMETSARNLLIQALDSCQTARVWGVSYEPSDGNFYLGIEPAVKADPTAVGGLRTLPSWNHHDH